MNPQFRHDLACEPHQADVLHNQGIDARVIQETQLRGCGIEFIGEDERVERDVGLHAVAVAELDHARQFLIGEVVRAHSRVKFRQPEIHRIRTVCGGGAQAVPASGGREKFGRFVHGCEIYTGSGVIQRR